MIKRQQETNHSVYRPRSHQQSLFLAAKSTDGEKKTSRQHSVLISLHLDIFSSYSTVKTAATQIEISCYLYRNAEPTGIEWCTENKDGHTLLGFSEHSLNL